MLLQKNEAYGNSAFDPVRIFSKASVQEQILVRIDDKLSRLSRGQNAGEDVIQDLIGYLIIYKAQEIYDRHKQTSNLEPIDPARQEEARRDREFRIDAARQQANSGQKQRSNTIQ